MGSEMCIRDRFYEIAWPVFKENNIPVTLFVSTDSVDKQMKGYMNWDQIRSFVNEGGTVGQHTSTHLHLPLNDKETIKSDILKSHKSFVKHLGFIPKLFAYPYGETSKLVIDVLGEFGIDHSFGQHSGVTSSYSNHYYLPRFSLNENFGTIDRFIFAAEAYSLRIEDFIPSEMYLVENKKPNIEFTIIDDLKNSDLNCFSNPGGKWNKQIINKITPDFFRATGQTLVSVVGASGGILGSLAGAIWAETNGYTILFRNLGLCALIATILMSISFSVWKE